MMKTIYMMQKQSQDNALEQASGGAGQMAGPDRRDGGLPAGGDKVIDMADWKAENLVEPDGPEGFDGRQSGLGQYEGRELVRRRHRKHAVSQARAELAATLVVVGVVAALLIWVLFF